MPEAPPPGIQRADVLVSANGRTPTTTDGNRSLTRRVRHVVLAPMRSTVTRTRHERPPDLHAARVTVLEDLSS
jgi:hypothetical protein